MSKTRIRKGSPLLLLVLLTIGALAVGAVLVNYWSHQMTKETIPYTILGMDAYAIQVPVGDGYTELCDNYKAKVVASTFESTLIFEESGVDRTEVFTNAVILALDDTNLDLTNGLVISVTFDITSPEVTASLSGAEYIMFYLDNSATATPKVSGTSSVPTITGDTITIPNTDIHLVYYDDTLVKDTGTTSNANALILEFTFTGVRRDAVDEEGWGTFYANCQVTIELGEDA